MDEAEGFLTQPAKGRLSFSVNDDDEGPAYDFNYWNDYDDDVPTGVLEPDSVSVKCKIQAG